MNTWHATLSKWTMAQVAKACSHALDGYSPDVNVHSARRINKYPDNKGHGANMGPIWGRQDPGGPHVGPMKLVIGVLMLWLANNPAQHHQGSISVSN